METERNEMKPRPARFFLPILALLATLAVGVGAGAVVHDTLSDTETVVQQEPVTNAEPTASTSAVSARQIYRDTREGVVEITVGSVEVDPFGGEQQQRGQGSGF